MSEAQIAHKLETLRHALRPIWHFIEENGVQEVEINSPNDVWVERKGQHCKESIKLSKDQIESAIVVIARMAGAEHNAKLIDGRFDGFRIAATLPPVAVNGATISIRKHNPVVLSLDNYVESGQLSEEGKEYLISLVKARKNILIAGGTGTGKTTFFNALVREVDQEERVVSIEDTHEIKVLVPNWVALEASPEFGVTCRSLLKHALRMRPDRVFLGEVRGGEAYDLLQAANTGHDGVMSTIHANNCNSTPTRFENLVLQAGENLEPMAIRQQIAMVFDAIVHIERVRGKRYIGEIALVEGFNTDNNQYQLKRVYKHGGS